MIRRSCRHLCLLVLFGSANVVLASGRPAAGSIRRGTVPPSSYQTSLVNMPSPIDNTNNQVITGNVSGGKAFRGSVPYGSTTSFGGRLGSTSLDSFVRYSAVPEELRDGPSGYTPFYSSTGTVSKIQPGTNGVFAPGSPKIAGVPMQFHAEQPADMIPPAEIPPSQVLASQMPGGRLGDGSLPSAGRLQASPERVAQLWSRTPEEMRRLIIGEPGDPSAERRLAPQSKQIMTSEEYQRQLEQLQRDLDRVKTNASQFEQDLKTGKQTPVPALEQRSVEPAQPTVSAEALRRIFQPQGQPPAANLPAGQDLLANPATLIPDGSVASGQTPSEIPASSSGLVLMSPQSSATGARAGGSAAPGFGLYGQPPSPGPSSSELTAQKSRIDAIFAPRTDGTATEKPGDVPPARSVALGARDNNTGELPAMQRVEKTARAFDAPGRLIERPLQDSTGGVPSSTAGGDWVSQSQDPPQAALEGATRQGKIQANSSRPPESLPAARTAPKPATLDPASKEKFDRYLKSAQLDMQQGRYAHAAESFALASVYNPRDPRPQLGRSHALLAAGEYLGSAVCLAKAIELDPRSTLAKSDLIEAVGGPDQFIQRVTDLGDRVKTSNAPGLQLLLAYIYHQMDRPEEARTAVRAAKQGLPSSTSVDLLQAAIEGVAPG